MRLTDSLGTADELVFAASEGGYYRKRSTFFSAEFVECHEGGEADHLLIWMTVEEALTRLSHKSQVWAAMQACRP